MANKKTKAEVEISELKAWRATEKEAEALREMGFQIKIPKEIRAPFSELENEEGSGMKEAEGYLKRRH